MPLENRKSCVIVLRSYRDQ